MTSLISIALNTLNAEQISLTAHFYLSMYHPYFLYFFSLKFQNKLGKNSMYVYVYYNYHLLNISFPDHFLFQIYHQANCAEEESFETQ